MLQYPSFPDTSTFRDLKGKVVVVAGGASGIGAALVTTLHNYGAHVVLGDVNHDTGEKLIQSLSATRQTTDSSILTFACCDVCKYGEVYSVFRTALGKHGRVDHAVFCAGVIDSSPSSYFDVTLTCDSVGKDQGDTRTLDVNFLAACSFARIALPFLRRPTSNEEERGGGGGGGEEEERKDEGRSDDRITLNRSLTFLSSVTGFRDAPGMFLYQTSKQAILGLMRALRTAIFARDGIRINAVCPGMTESPMTSASGLIDLFKNRTPASIAELPSHYQSPEAVAGHIVAVIMARGVNGKSIYVEEGQGWEFEDGLARDMPRWLGEQPTQWSNENLRFLESLEAL